MLTGDHLLYLFLLLLLPADFLLQAFVEVLVDLIQKINTSDWRDLSANLAEHWGH